MDERDASQPEVAATSARTITRAFLRVRRAKSDHLEAAPVRAPKPTYPYLTRMLAFAHALERRIEEGEVEGRQELARRLGISPARLTQILDLTLLAPDIQQRILDGAGPDGKAKLSLRAVRPMALAREWSKQRELWSTLCKRPRPLTSARSALRSGAASSDSPAAATRVGWTLPRTRS